MSNYTTPVPPAEPTTLCEDCWNHMVAITSHWRRNVPVMGTDEECDYRTEHGTYIVQLWIDGMCFSHETPAMPVAEKLLVRLTAALQTHEHNYDLEIVS